MSRPRAQERSAPLVFVSQAQLEQRMRNAAAEVLRQLRPRRRAMAPFWIDPAELVRRTRHLFGRN
ncbi:MAG TPA: hypothetical protein VJS92_10470 [Candidatus Polarisedimenticolaceae bacterium]|nr:hypothetical protein [Candidatus Polarisedimenticolaceae bacterium]